MKLVAFPILKEKEKINKKNIGLIAGIVLLLLLLVGYSEFNLGDYLQKLAAGIVTVTERNYAGNNDRLVPGELELTLPGSQAGTYEQTAQQGDGMTHLARRAFKEYADKTGKGADLSAEHKVYIEDYLAKQAGNKWLELDEKVSFSSEQINEALEKALQLSEEQLKNLEQYSSKISSF